MRQMLKLHPDSHCAAAIQIEVEIARPRADSLALSYIVTGEVDDVRMPALSAPLRSDDLWQHTCLEAFVRASSGDDYYEFNFSPSTQWAAYRFSGYRSGMKVADETGVPQIEVQSNPGCYTLDATLALDRLTGLPRKALWRLGLSALIEDTEGRKSYWALAHPPGNPDFHHADCFAFEFSREGRP